MADWFDTSDLSAPKVTMEHYREWAGEIANSYFNAGVTPTETLTKIAQAEDLLPHQIQTLAAEANKFIHQTKYAKEDEKYFAAHFPLADSAVVIKDLQIDGGGVKVAAMQFTPPKISAREPDIAAAYGLKLEDIGGHDKTAAVKSELKYASDKLRLIGEKIQDRILQLQTSKEAAEVVFIKEARAHLLEESSSEDRLRVLARFDHFVKCANSHKENLKPDVANRLFAKLAAVLMKEGKLYPAHGRHAINYFTKTAQSEAPKALISDRLPVQVVNGDHHLYITLKTIGDLEADLLRFVQQDRMVQDKAHMVTKKIQAL